MIVHTIAAWNLSSQHSFVYMSYVLDLHWAKTYISTSLERYCVTGENVLFHIHTQLHSQHETY